MPYIPTMNTPYSGYAKYIAEDIREIVQRRGITPSGVAIPAGARYIVPDSLPPLVEAWMRLQHPTLDALSPRQFRREVEVALGCIAEAGLEESARLAESFGLLLDDDDTRVYDPSEVQHVVCIDPDCACPGHPTKMDWEED